MAFMLKSALKKGAGASAEVPSQTLAPVPEKRATSRAIFPNPERRSLVKMPQVRFLTRRNVLTAPEAQWLREQYVFTSPFFYLERAAMSMVGAAWMGVISASWSLGVGATLVGLAFWRLRDMLRAFSERAPLSGMPMTYMRFEALWEKVARAPLPQKTKREVTSVRGMRSDTVETVLLAGREDRARIEKLGREITSLYLGEGFPWEAEKTRALYQLADLPVKSLRVPDWVRRAYRYPPALAASAIGTPLLHGVGLKAEETITHPIKSLGGGTIIVGTTQSGKGVMLTNLITQAIFRQEAVIVIDPKSSKRLRSAIRTACQKAGRRAPWEFHPAFPEESVRLDPLGSWSRPSEIASRLTAMLPPDQGIFNDFAWSAVNVLVNGLFYLTEKPTLVKLRHLLEGGMENLLLRAMKKDLDERGPRDWEEQFKAMPYPTENRLGYPVAEVQKLAEFWESLYAEALRGPGPEVIHPLLAVYRHNRDHYAKITASLQPILAMLTTGSLSDMLSPDPMDEDDTRPVVTLERVLEAGDVLYLGLDALPDRVIAGALGNLLLSDLTSYTGKRYNRGTSGRSAPRISLFVDETANVINQPMIELLNKGMEAGVHVTAAMQTVADLTAALGENCRALQALGNFNNLIALRTKDGETQEFVLETFGAAMVWSEGVALGSASMSEIVPTFRASITRTSSAKREALIPQEMLGKLPDGEFFASIAGGKIFKGRMPVVVDSTPEA